MKKYLYILLLAGLAGCDLSQNNNVDRLKAKGVVTTQDTGIIKPDTPATQPATANLDSAHTINTKNTNPSQLMQFAETQIGVPYRYGSCDPKKGFDCSGFITYVFNHFNIQVPRTSYGFTHMGETVPVTEAKRGDIILFTGTDSLADDVGHIGLIMANNNGTISFIHSTSGKQMAVTVTTLDDYYKSRFVRIARVFPQNGNG